MEYKPSTKSINGTSLKGHVTCSYNDLVKIFGYPNAPSDDYKVSTSWVLEDDKGNVHTIYDYKETNLYDDSYPTVEEFRTQPSHDWHIGAHKGIDPNYLVNFIKENI